MGRGLRRAVMVLATMLAGLLVMGAGVLPAQAARLPKTIGVKEVVASSVEVYPSATAKKSSGTVSKGAALRHTGVVSKGRLQVVRSGTVIWVENKSSKIATLPLAKTKVEVTKKITLFRSSTSSELFDTVSAGTKLKHTGTVKAGRLQIVHRGRVLWGDVSRTSFAMPKPTKKSYVSRVKVGTSVQGRDFYAYQVGDPQASTSALVIGQIHGDEKAGVKTARALIDDTRTVKGLSLWVILTVNPDGNAASTRVNARGVDLNRNWPTAWEKSAKGRKWSGPKALSEPETRALKAFLAETKPDKVVGLHQPLNGVDSGEPKVKKLQKALVKQLGLPAKEFSCYGGCHGTMTQWYNKNHEGAAITVEYPAKVSTGYATKTARDGLVKALGGRY